MPAKGYCTTAAVSDFLGMEFTSAQEVQAGRLIESTEQLIDAYTGRGWLVGEQTGEVHMREEYWRSGIVYLRYAPVSAVTAIVTGEGVALVVDVDYEIISLENGAILLTTGAYSSVTVQYTPVASVPAPIRDACAEWTAARLLPALRPDTYGLESYSLPDLTVKFAKGAQAAQAPAILDLYAYKVHG